MNHVCVGQTEANLAKALRTELRIEYHSPKVRQAWQSDPNCTDCQLKQNYQQSPEEYNKSQSLHNITFITYPTIKETEKYNLRERQSLNTNTEMTQKSELTKTLK